MRLPLIQSNAPIAGALHFQHERLRPRRTDQEQFLGGPIAMAASGGGFLRRMFGVAPARQADMHTAISTTTRARTVLRPLPATTTVNPLRSESIDSELRPAPRLFPARTWAIQLQNVAHDQIANCTADIVIIEPSRQGSLPSLHTREHIASMRLKPDGAPKKLLAYLSIAETEQARTGVTNASAGNAWLGAAGDASWSTARNVRFWHRDWQAMMYGQPTATVDRLIDAGFDGVMLDGVDKFAYWMHADRGAERRPTADSDMVDLVTRIAEHGRRQRNKPDFAVIPLNGEHLLTFPRYLAAISAIATESVFYNGGEALPPRTTTSERDTAGIERKLSYLRLALEARAPILAIEYLRDRAEDATLLEPARRHMRENGFSPYFARRQLDALSDIEIAPQTN